MAESPTPVSLLRDVAPTKEHAARLFERVVALLGDRGRVHTSGGGRNRALFVTTGAGGGYLLPWPLLTFAVADLAALEEEEPEEPPGVLEPDPVTGRVELPLHTLRPVPASLTVHDGPVQIAVNYRRDGRWKDMSRPRDPDAFAGLLGAARAADPAEALAAAVASIDLGRHGPARVHLPRMTPGGVGGTWSTARGAIREAMYARRAPRGSFWAFADGYVGSAIAFGSSRAEAAELWRREVERVRPAPPRARPEESAAEPPPWTPRAWDPEEPPEETRTTIRITGWDAPPFDPSPSAVPGAVVRVAETPATPPPRGEWTRWISDQGATTFAVRLPIPGGWTLVGEGLLRVVDLETIDATLDALDEAHPGMVTACDVPVRPDSPPRTHSTVCYECVEPSTGCPREPRSASSVVGPAFDVRGFDGGRFRTQVVRVRRLAGPPDSPRS